MKLMDEIKVDRNRYCKCKLSNYFRKFLGRILGLELYLYIKESVDEFLWVYFDELLGVWNFGIGEGYWESYYLKVRLFLMFLIMGSCLFL